MSTWPVQTFGGVFDVKYGKALPQNQRRVGAQIPVVGSAGVMAYTDTALVREPCLIIGRKGNVGQVHYHESGAWPTDTTFYVKLPASIDARFLKYQLDHLNLRRLDSSTATPSLRRQDLESQNLVLPEVAVQRRVFAILEDHLSRLDAADRWLTDTERRIRAWMAGVSDSLIWRPNFAEVTVASVLREPMRNGRSDRASEDGRGVRTLTLTAVTRNEFADEHTKVTVTSPEVAEGLWLEEGDIFVQRANTPDLVGTSARYSGPDKWAIFPDLLIRVRPDETVISSQFLNMALRTERAHRSLRAHAKGLAGSMPKIDQKSVGNAVVPLPSMQDQQRLVDTLEYAETGTRNLLNVSRAAARRSVALRRATLSAAFDGRLTGRREDAEIIEELADV